MPLGKYGPTAFSFRPVDAAVYDKNGHSTVPTFTNSTGAAGLPKIDAAGYVEFWVEAGDYHLLLTTPDGDTVTENVTVAAGGVDPASEYMILGSGNDATTVTVPAGGAFVPIGPMLGPAARGIWGTSNPDGVSPPEGWTITDVGSAMNTLRVPAGRYLVWILSIWSGPTDGYRQLGGLLVSPGTPSAGSVQGDNPSISGGGWVIPGFVVVKSDGDPLFGDLSALLAVANTATTDATVTYFEFDIFRLS